MKRSFQTSAAGLRVPRVARAGLGRGHRPALALGCLLLCTAPGAQAAAGALDPSFGTAGKVRTPLDPVSGETLYSLAVQPDGKIVAAGFGPAGAGMAVTRYNPDGTLDPSFGGTGIVTLNLLSFSGAHAVSVQPDGKIVVAGQASDGILARFGLARFNPDGALDSTFGPGGDGRMTASAAPYSMYATALAIQPDGRLVAAGQIDHGGEPAGPAKDFAVVRYTANGLLDTSFGSAGTGAVTTDFSTHDDVANALALQPDGKILAAGAADAALGSSSKNFALARYLPDGSPDTSFGAGGKVVTDFEGDSDEAHGVVVLPDGNILVGGAMTHPGGSGRAFALARYHADGSPDLSFGSGGKVTTVFPAGPSAANALAVQTNGKILLAGTVVTSDYNTAWGLARYLADGSPDISFGTDGLVVTNFDTGVDIAQALVIQADGKIVAGGMGYADEYYPGTPGATGWDFTLARYLGDALPADLVLTKVATPSPAIAGGTLTYTLTVTNQGPGEATDLVLADTLPPTLSPLSLTATGGGVADASGDGTLTVEWSSIAAGGSETATLVATVDPAVSDGATISNTAFVETASPDPNTANNLATAETVVQAPHTVVFYLHGGETPGTAGGYTMDLSSVQASGDTLQLWKNVRWFSSPALTGTFLPGATAKVTLPRLTGRGASATFYLKATQPDGSGAVALGQTTQVLGTSGANTVTIPLSAAPVTLVSRRLELSVATSPGVNLKIERAQAPALEVTHFAGTP